MLKFNDQNDDMGRPAKDNLQSAMQSERNKLGHASENQSDNSFTKWMGRGYRSVG